MGAAWSEGDLSTYLSQVNLPGDANLLEVGKDGKLTVYQLNGNGNCHRLPGKIDLAKNLKDVEQKRMFITTPGDQRNLRLYIDDICETRANEETYMKKATLNNQNILHFPATDQQNATHYKINNTEPNKPPLPFFSVTPKDDSKRRFAAERAVSDCRPIPYVSSGENYSATVGVDAGFQRDLSSLSLYTDSECTNIYAQTREEINREDNSYYPFSITTNPYTNIKGYGGRVMHKTNARFYKIKDEKWNVINDIDPKKFAAAKAAREERARLKAEKEAADRQASLKKLAEDEERARVKSVMDKIARERDAAERARLEAIQRALQAQRESQQRQAALNAANSARVAAVNRQANIWRTIFRPPPPPPRRPPPRRRGRWW
jgi:hypothetical protein